MPDATDPSKTTTDILPANPAAQSVPAKTESDATDKKTGPDEIEFFDFARQYLGLLAGLAAVPILTNGLGVIPTPGGADLKNLSMAASLLSIIAFGAVFSVRQILGRTQDSRYFVVRAIPALLVLISLAMATWQISVYVPETRASTAAAGAGSAGVPAAGTTQTVPVQSRANATASQVPAPVIALVTTGIIFRYFLIQILLVFAIGIVLITAFTMQEAHKIQNIIERDMQAERFQILERLRYTDDFYKLARDNPPFQAIGQELVLNLRHRDLERLASGCIVSVGDAARQLQERLLFQFRDTFDAVSDQDLKFWRQKDKEPFSQAYDQLVASAAERGTEITRLFLFSDAELATWRCVAKVLIDHEERDYGWAVAPYRTVDRAVLDTEHDLDFALFNGDAAISYFRDYHSSFRRLEVTFSGVAQKRNTEIVGAQAKRFLKLSAQAWVCNGSFARRIGGIFAAGAIGGYKLDDSLMPELHKALRASTLGNSRSIPGDDRVRVQQRLQSFNGAAEGAKPESDWRDALLIDPRQLQSAPGPQLSAEEIDLIAWKMLSYRISSPNWSGPATCDMLLVTNTVVSQREGTMDCDFTADVRGIGFSAIHHEKIRILCRVKDSHGTALPEREDVFQKDEYDEAQDLYHCRQMVSIQTPGRYYFEIEASDGSSEDHCKRMTARGCWTEIKRVP